MWRLVFLALIKIKPANILHKNYVETLLLASLIFAWISITAIVRSNEISVMETLAEDRNVSTTRILSVILQNDVENLLMGATDYSPSDLAHAPVVVQLLNKMTLFLHGSNIAKVKIYNLDGLTLFSSQVSQIGENKISNAGFLSARSGRTASELVKRNQFSAFEGERFRIDLLSSYIPVIVDGKVIAIFEQYQDVTNLINIIDQSLWKQALIMAAIFIGIYAVLLIVIRQSRATERRHVAALHAANQLLDDRVAERTAELRLSEERFRRLTAISSDFFWESDATHHFVIHRSDPSAETVAGSNSSGFLDVMCGEAPKRAEDKAAWEAYHAVLDAHQPFRNFEISGETNDGNELYITVSGDPIFTEDGIFLGYHGVGSDISERKHNEDLIRELAYFDQLTGLPNRTLLYDRLEIAIADADRYSHYCVLMQVDIDKFKALNDTLGHTIGDRLLRQVAQRLTECVRDGDTVAHLGGDEFIVILKGVTAASRDQAIADIIPIAERLLKDLHRPYQLGKSPYQATVSIGVVLGDGRSETIADLFRQADIALLKSKESGGGVFRFFDSEMERILFEMAQYETDIREGMKQQQFELYFQPQVHPSSGVIRAAEALLRWNHPSRGLVPPNDFIPHAERTGLIISLGQWVLESACQHLREWAAHPDLSKLTLSVNVSPKQLQDDGFAASVKDTLRRTGADPNRLKLELTESVFANNPDRIAATMADLCALGVTFSLDDFGTGYSSLSYLSALPIDQLKIDRSFVKGIEAGDRNLAICLATIRIARSLNLKVVAEGVENKTEAYVLGAVHNCDLLQGFLFGRPMTRKVFEQACADSVQGPPPRARRRTKTATSRHVE